MNSFYAIYDAQNGFEDVLHWYGQAHDAMAAIATYAREVWANVGVELGDVNPATLRVTLIDSITYAFLSASVKYGPSTINFGCLHY